MWDVVVDLRPGSPTFLSWDAVTLSPRSRARVYVPPGCGHGFLSMQDGTGCLYIKFGAYDASKEVEVNAFDPEIGITWPPPLGEAAEYVMSVKDRGLRPAADALQQVARRCRL
eukprot:SRR837773.26103.p3 GENE.SRR837773.26103~~SRR837773.26103.p3  ORF type:complete len:113 (+),score=29.42 SRR837773.26103:2-340(+)